MARVCRVDWSGDAVADLLEIPDRSICVEILDLAEAELERAPGPSSIQGVALKYPHLWWRRVVRRANISQLEGFDINNEVDNDAQDYVIVYRMTTFKERIKFRRLRQRYIILRVLHNREFARRYHGS
jgi:hypothetical protein